MILKEILAEIHDWAPPGIAQSYDNVGLQIGDPAQEISCGLIALEVTPAVISEAEDAGAQLIVTHHPLIFRPIRSISTASLVGATALRLARSGIALVAAHTNLDAVKDGVSNALADLLGLTGREFLSPLSEGMLKLVTFVPADHAEAVRESMSRAGAGRIGDYSDVAFKSQGFGVFRPLASADPFIGTASGGVESVQEWRIEVALTRDRLQAVIGALYDAHPYETPVFDVYEMVETVSGFGLGIIGNLAEPEPLPKFLDRVCSRLLTKAVRYTGDPSADVRRVAVCGGAGRDLIPTAMRRGADAYVTSDISYHSFFEVQDGDGNPRMALIDAGHYETEAATETLLLEWLTDRAPAVSWVRTTTRTSPISTFIST